MHLDSDNGKSGHFNTHFFLRAFRLAILFFALHFSRFVCFVWNLSIHWSFGLQLS